MKVKLQLPPGGIVITLLPDVPCDESKTRSEGAFGELGDPSVTVWPTVSRFTQVTVVPATTVRSEGLNA